MEENTLEELPEKDLPENSEKQSGFGSFFEYIELFVWSFFAVLLLFTGVFRLCRVEGSSMENTLFQSEPLLLSNVAYTPKQDDIIVFQRSDYKGGERLIKRVVALGGQTVRIDTSTNEITVDGVVYADSHSVLKNHSTNKITDIYDSHLFAYDYKNGVFETTVPEGFLFVMGDNRNNSLDSRSIAIGFVDSRCVLGKAVLRFKPFTLF